MRTRSLTLIFQVFVLVTSERRYAPRRSRLFTFNTIDDDIRIQLEFTIPFISIPIKKTMDAMYDGSGFSTLGLPMININPASIALGSAIVLGATVFVPLIIKKIAMHDPQDRYSRLLEAAQFPGEEMLDLGSRMLSESQSVRGCALRMACWTGQAYASPDVMKIWNHVLSNRLLSSMINSTAVEDAMLSGRQGRECGTYNPCPIGEQHLPMLMSNLAVLANNIY